MDEKLKKHLDAAYIWLSKIPVSGDAVDAMAKARQEKSTAWAILNDEEVKKDG